MYSYYTWNDIMSPFNSKEYLISSAEPPAEAEFHDDTKIGFRPIDPGSGVEFSKALGGNRQREQFTVVLLTYERDAVLTGALERLHQLPYLNKILVVWNNVHREPPDTWPALHVPVEFVRVAENSLNNRFVPWDRIETEAVLSLDDDIDLMQQEIVLAFRVWRENRERIVGFPARHHARFGDSMFYNSNHSCQTSMVLTGAAFVHKNYLRAYTYEMPSAIREHVDKIRNCEDIAMNYMVSHLTRRPPIKTTSRWTLKCPTCTESLFKEDSHFEKRHECMRLFTEIYGYNPLRFSQFRADSILFKTRLPQNHQKCFKYV
uniref:Glyco_transf_64 domain-containing protein n=1 Tax=Caenorhabditis japonica TaxID=281687 RepID=A0A8R1EQ46_CAEJA